MDYLERRLNKKKLTPEQIEQQKEKARLEREERHRANVKKNPRRFS